MKLLVLGICALFTRFVAIDWWRRYLCCYRCSNLVKFHLNIVQQTATQYTSRLEPKEIGMIIDRGIDFPPAIQEKLESYGTKMWLFRDHADRATTKALNYYKGDHRGYE